MQNQANHKATICSLDHRSDGGGGAGSQQHFIDWHQLAFSSSSLPPLTAFSQSSHSMPITATSLNTQATTTTTTTTTRSIDLNLQQHQNYTTNHCLGQHQDHLAASSHTFPAAQQAVAAAAVAAVVAAVVNRFNGGGSSGQILPPVSQAVFDQVNKNIKLDTSNSNHRLHNCQQIRNDCRSQPTTTTHPQQMPLDLKLLPGIFDEEDHRTSPQSNTDYNDYGDDHDDDAMIEVDETERSSVPISEHANLLEDDDDHASGRLVDVETPEEVLAGRSMEVSANQIMSYHSPPSSSHYNPLGLSSNLTRSSVQTSKDQKNQANSRKGQEFTVQKPSSSSSACSLVTQKDTTTREESPHPMKQQSSSAPQQAATTTNKQRRLYKCRHCGFETDNKAENWEHIRIHMRPEKMLECKSCQFVTEYKHHLEYHQRNHSGYKPFKCEHCDYQCVNKSMLNSHMKSHSPVYQYQCGDCKYATKYVHSLKMHLRKYNHQPAQLLIDIYGRKRGPKSNSSSSSSTQELQCILDLRVNSKHVE